MVAPTSCTVLEPSEVEGATPGWSERRSVKLRPLSGTAAICRPLITSPNWVLTDSTCNVLSHTLTVSVIWPISSEASSVSAASVSSTMFLR